MEIAERELSKDWKRLILMTKMIIGEEDFPEALKNRILPWVQANLEEGYFQSNDGTKIHYHCAIHPEEKASIVISHGFCEFVSKYYEVMYYFYSVGYSVFFLEYRGHGFSDRTVEEMDRVTVGSYEEYVEDLHGFVEQVVKKNSLSHRYLLFAHSMGGCIASLYLEEHPEIFERAVLSAPLLQMNYGNTSDFAVSILMAISKVLPWDLKYVPGQHGFDNRYAFETSSAQSEPRYAYVFSERQREPHYTSYGGTYAWTRASIKAIKRVHKHLNQIQIPVLICQAGLDNMVRPDGQKRFAEDTVHTRLMTFPTSKHEIFNALYEVRIPYYEAVFGFFEEQYGNY